MYKVTVGICCYKQKEWLYRCLRSLASQTMHKDSFEVVVVNDDPDQDLSDICAQVGDALNIRLINNDANLGLPVSLNKILRSARGRYFVRVDSDDYVSKHFLYMLSSYLDVSKRKQAVACDYKKVTDCGITLGEFSFKEHPVACGIMFTYESLCNIGYYNEEWKMREGHELLERFDKKYNIGYLDIPLYRYRMHTSNRSNLEEMKEYDKKLNG